MPKKTAPQQRSAEWLRDRGYLCQSTEQTIRYPSKEKPGTWTMFKRDLFNFCDLVAIHQNHSGTLYVQVTAGMNNKGERQAKIEAAPATMPILRAGNTIELHIWRKMGPRGAKVKNWKVARFHVRISPECSYLNGVPIPKLEWVQVFDDGTEDEFDRVETPSLFASSPP